MIKSIRAEHHEMTLLDLSASEKEKKNHPIPYQTYSTTKVQLKIVDNDKMMGNEKKP
jgi:hypothetical protein